MSGGADPSGAYDDEGYDDRAYDDRAYGDGPGHRDGTGDGDREAGPGSAPEDPARPETPPAGAAGGTDAHRARIPLPRAPVEDGGPPPPAAPLVLAHPVLKSLLGAWALAACSAEESAAVDRHLGECGACAEEARRLRTAVGLLRPPETLDPDPSLRTRVLDDCLARRPPRIPVPEWTMPYDAETARLDALLQDIGDADWHAPVRLRWFADGGTAGRRTTVAGTLAHLLAVDGLVAVALGLADPLGEVPAGEPGPAGRTEAYWRSSHLPPTRAVRAPWRAQTHALVRTTAFTGGGDAGRDAGGGRMPVSYGDFALPLRDAMVDRAFECWMHAEDIAEAVAYPYHPPAARHLHRMVDLTARLLPAALAERRRAGKAASDAPRHLVAAGTPGRSLRLEIEGSGGGQWLIPLDSPAAVGSPEHEVAYIALDDVEFCRLAAGRVPPEEAAAGRSGDRQAIRDVLFATASLSRM
jgi:hypothetical protein